MALISDKWKNELNSLSQKDYITLTKAILFDLPEPQISANNQYIADRIYASLKERTRAKEGMQKTRRERNNSVTLQECYSNNSVTLQECYGQEEKKEKASPPSSPSSSPPHPLNNTPYNPPLEREKREDSPSSLTLTNPQGGDISLERADNPAKIPLPERFDKLWDSYPRKIGKKRAFDAYKKAIKSGTTDEVIADGIERYRQYVESRKFEEKYIKQGSTWFAGECWNDEYDISARQLTADEEREYQELWGG